MTAYVTIPNTDVDQDSPVTVALMTALRDNLAAMREGASGSPVLGLTPLATASISGVAAVDFTAFDATRYESYLFVFSNVVPVTNAVDLLMRTSTDGGSTFDTGVADYAWSISKNAAATSANGDTDMKLVEDVSNAANQGASGGLDIVSPGVTDYTIIKGVFGAKSSAVLTTQTSGGARLSAANVDAVRFFFSSGNLSTGTITMYGRGQL